MCATAALDLELGAWDYLVSVVMCIAFRFLHFTSDIPAMNSKSELRRPKMIKVLMIL
jgi:hypothetical protein